MNPTNTSLVNDSIQTHIKMNHSIIWMFCVYTAQFENQKCQTDGKISRMTSGEQHRRPLHQRNHMLWRNVMCT